MCVSVHVHVHVRMCEYMFHKALCTCPNSLTEASLQSRGGHLLGTLPFVGTHSLTQHFQNITLVGHLQKHT